MSRITGLSETDGDLSAKVCQQTRLINSAIHSTNGRWDMVLELQTRSLEEFDRILGRIRGLKGISSSETSILLSSTRTGSPRV
jgi:DNA-binding Lrp family transcriptional regulator